ncbi:hypothetical protein ACHAXR_002377, partial [Thalassiosira sp. AJA248-18]
EGTIPPRGGFIEVHTFAGHEFSYDIDGTRHYIVAKPHNPKGNRLAMVAGDSDGFHVRCEIERETTGRHIDILVKPYWAPRGASHFLGLVRQKYYDGVVLNRVVPQFLTQFGIARDYEVRMDWDSKPILDDDPEMNFEPGFISFAGNGPDSRTTEVFIAMPGTSQEQLDYFGENTWETPFGKLISGSEDDEILTELHSEYGDMPPWGEGERSNRKLLQKSNAIVSSYFTSMPFI